MVDSEASVVRSFIGIAVADTGLEATLSECQQALQRLPHLGEVRWTPSHFLHLTLSFMGNRTRDTLARLQPLLAEALATVTVFPITLTHCSGFPDAKSRILAALPEPTAPLLVLQQVVTQAVSTAGIDTDSRPFLPHITLGRFGRQQPVVQLDVPLQGTGWVQAVSLYRSDALESGSHYSVIARWPFLS